MANPRFNKQVANPRGMKVGGRVKKMGGGMSTRRDMMYMRSRYIMKMIWV